MFNLSAIAPQLQSGTLILTPNNRLKNKLLLAWGQQQGMSASVVWQAPNVLSLSDWLQQSWQQLQFTGQRQYLRIKATPPVRRKLWANCLAESEDTNPLVHPRLLVDQLDQAYRYLKLWRVEEQHWQLYGGADQRRVKAWVANFELQLSRLELISEESMLEMLCDNAASSTWGRQKSVCLLNFDTLSPLEQQLLEYRFEQRESINSNQIPAQQQQRFVCKDPQQEMLCAAQWAKNTLQQQPSLNLAIIDPNLGRNRSRLERVLARVFEPSHHLPSSPRYTMPFNFSAGTPLALCPIIYDALETLSWHHSKLPEHACQWFNSPFVGSREDVNLRHWLTSKLLASQRQEVSLNFVVNQLDNAQQQPAHAAVTKTASWRQGFMRLQQWPSSQSGKQWAAEFLTTLEYFNWPGPRALDSEEHQQVAQFFSLLEQLSEADWLQKPLSRADIVSWLRDIVSRQPFQPQTPESPLQVLGALESAGLAFDQIWVLGMDDTQWPPAASPNPLLPVQMQRELLMPHSSAERELDFCQAITRNYLHAASAVNFSHAARDGDRELTVSPLIAAIGIVELPPQQDEKFSGANFEWLKTDSAPAVTPQEMTTLRGGSGMLQKQARCPLAAFMELRLGATRPDIAKPGLNALDRGTLLHQALYYFWQQRPQLGQVSSEQLTDLLEAAIAAACAEVTHLQASRYLALEQDRLRQILGKWVQIEKTRPAFDIESLEQALEFKLGRLPLKLRLDRIDKVGGQWLLIDYKSGASNIQKWLGDRPEEPQLPLYAIALSDQKKPIAAIAFVELRQQRQALLGVGGETLCDGIKVPGSRGLDYETWDSLLEHWRNCLLTLADELLDGTTTLEYSSAQTQEYLAHLNPLLRNAEQTSLHATLQAQGAKS